MRAQEMNEREDDLELLADVDWDTVRRSNRDVFGHNTFRPGQRSAIRATLQSRDVFVLMPTGGANRFVISCQR